MKQLLHTILPTRQVCLCLHAAGLPKCLWLRRGSPFTLNSCCYCHFNKYFSFNYFLKVIEQQIMYSFQLYFRMIFYKLNLFYIYLSIYLFAQPFFVCLFLYLTFCSVILKQPQHLTSNFFIITNIWRRSRIYNDLTSGVHM